MNRPDNIVIYDDIDPKLGIKSSLPHVKSVLALVSLLWECENFPAELIYSVQDGDKIVLTSELEQQVISILAEICSIEQIDEISLIAGINNNQLFKSQMEALIVAFECVWKLAKVRFVDDMPASAERKGRVRYPKKLLYSINIDIISCVINSSQDAYLRVLMSWMGFSVKVNSEYDHRLMDLFTVLSENAIFKLIDGDQAVIFNQNNLYIKALETGEPVDINGDDEVKGPLRILKSLLSDGGHPFLVYSNGCVSVPDIEVKSLELYQKRLDVYCQLSGTRVIRADCSGTKDLEFNDACLDDLESVRVSGGSNILLYGVPGSGKSWMIVHEYCSDKRRMERLVFYPDYTHSDFIGQILPDTSGDKLSYPFVPGPFTLLLKKAYLDPYDEYFLVIEEINRGNAPAIFGEVFQLLDRLKEPDDEGYPIGTSEYGITNANIARIVYGNPDHKVRIPSNMHIIGTMNTSDQSVFPFDTAFTRRWDMLLVENSFEHVDPAFADHVILDTEVTWRVFCEVINAIILEKNTGLTSFEDKRLGTYFVHMRDIVYDDRVDEAWRSGSERMQAKRNNRRFPEKVLKYLWDDVFQFSREDVFDIDNYNSLESIIKKFTQERGNDRFSVFSDSVYNLLTDPDVQDGDV